MSRASTFVFLGVTLSVPALLCGGTAAQSRRPAAPPRAIGAGSAEADFFETRIRPLLVENCSKCHGAAKQLGGLRLDTREGLLRGGGRGAAVAPGRPSESLLLRAVSHEDAALKMPPSAKLPHAQIAALREWVLRGAVWPQDAGTSGAGGSLWSVTPVRRESPPAVKAREWVRSPIDAFILQKLEAARMKPAPAAGRRELMRRATLDLTGLPPTPEEMRTFLSDTRPEAYERLVDRLLASPHYGERWARYWLDLVRYADSNGYERDAEKTHSWKYRDYVIRSLNADKPYDRFVTEQLAGDELPDRTEETVTATGFLRVGTWDDEPNDPAQYQYERLDDLVHASSTAFLGLTVKCARCHDHKFDPIPQRDYYAVAAAFWGGYLPPGDGKLMGGPPPDRLGYPVLGFTDRSKEAPPLRLLHNGDPKREGPEVAPGYLSLVPGIAPDASPTTAGASTTYRRTQLARWIVDSRNPLTPRVMVNRLWQHHFGAGLVRTPNNFGRKGSQPTHPALLDWLASDFIRGGWRVKRMHRLIMLSSTYRMASVHPNGADYAQKDDANERWWRFNRRRLDADALRDAMLAVSGQLNVKAGGPGFSPTVSKEALEGLSRKGAEWVASPPEAQRRRSIYMFLKRSLLMPLLTVFDFPDTTQPVEQRDASIVAPQALALLNNAFVLEQASALAARVEAEAGADQSAQVERAWWVALGRAPSSGERAGGIAHLSDRFRRDGKVGLASLCHVLLNTNEFIYVD